MKKIVPGYNEPGWTGQVQCTKQKAHFAAQDDGKGCGALLEVTKADLYVVPVHDIRGERSEVRFTCFCGAENLMPFGELFTELPYKQDWHKSHKSG